MVNPITTTISDNDTSDKDKQHQSLEEIVNHLAKHEEEIREIIIRLNLLTSSPFTAVIGHAMAAEGALSGLDPDMTRKLIAGMSKGLQRAEEGLLSNMETSIFQVLRALHDPDVNRAIGFGLNLLKGLGEGLKIER